MTAAQDTRALEAYVQWCEQVGRARPKADFSPFQAGYLAAQEEYRGLLEAARAYRDAQAAIVEFVDDHPGEAGKEWAKLFNAVDRATARLQIAARTFEASHEGETG